MKKMFLFILSLCVAQASIADSGISIFSSFKLEYCPSYSFSKTCTDSLSYAQLETALDKQCLADTRALLRAKGNNCNAVVQACERAPMCEELQNLKIAFKAYSAGATSMQERIFRQMTAIMTSNGEVAESGANADAATRIGN